MWDVGVLKIIDDGDDDEEEDEEGARVIGSMFSLFVIPVFGVGEWKIGDGVDVASEGSDF